MDICEFVYSLTLKVSRHRVTAEASDGTLDSDVKQLLYSVSASNANMQNTVHHSAKIKKKNNPKKFLYVHTLGNILFILRQLC